MLDFHFSILECSNGETHVKQIKACNVFYKENREFERLKVVTAKEKKFRAQTKPKTVHQKILEDTKSRFTADVKLYLNIAVNQVKIAGHGASVENFNTTRIGFAPKNRNTLVNPILHRGGHKVPAQLEDLSWLSRGWSKKTDFS